MTRSTAIRSSAGLDCVWSPVGRIPRSPDLVWRLHEAPPGRHRQGRADHPDGHAIGLDIGATAVRAAILAPGTLEGRPSVTVHGLGAVPLPHGAVVSGVVRDQQVLTAALKHLWQTHKFACRNVILGIANQQVLVRDMQVPNLDPQQRAMWPFQAREIVALPMDQVVLDFAQLGEVDPETNMISGLLIATPRATGARGRRGSRTRGTQSARESTCRRSPHCARSRRNTFRWRRLSTSAPT